VVKVDLLRVTLRSRKVVLVEGSSVTHSSIPQLFSSDLKVIHVVS
jgi:hypothetical protein